MTRASSWRVTPDTEVTEYLLDHCEGNALVEQQRRGRVPVCVHVPVLQTGALENVGLFLPVMPRIQRLAVRLAEHEIVICSCPAGQRSFQGLRLLMVAEDPGSVFMRSSGRCTSSSRSCMIWE